MLINLKLLKIQRILVLLNMPLLPIKRKVKEFPLKQALLLLIKTMLINKIVFMIKELTILKIKIMSIMD